MKAALAARFEDIGGFRVPSPRSDDPRQGSWGVAFGSMSDAVTALVIVSVLVGRENPSPSPGSIPEAEAELLLVRLLPKPGESLPVWLV